MPELVGDREVAPAGAALRLDGVDVDTSLRGKEQPRQRAASRERRRAGERQEVGVFLDVEAIVLLREMQRVDGGRGQLTKTCRVQKGSRGRLGGHLVRVARHVATRENMTTLTYETTIGGPARNSIAWGPALSAMSALRPLPSSRPFVPRTDAELSALPDDELVAYVARAKRCRATEQARTAVFLLLYRHEKRMRAKLRAQLPAFLSHHAETIEEWVLGKVWESALKLPLKGESPGEWTNWWKTVVTRQVISFWRSKQGQALEQEIEWPDQRVAGDDEGSTGADTVGEDFDIDSLALSLDYRAAITAALDTLSDTHRAIVEAAYFEDRPSKDVGAEVGETHDNVDQIKKRFREVLRAELVSRGVWES